MTVRNQKKTKLVIYGVVILCAVFIPLIIKDSYLIHLFIISMVWACVVTNWNLTLGYGGMFHIAQPTFLAVGGYTAAIMTNSFGVNPWLALLLAGVSSVVASIIIGMPSLRVKGIYLILLTFAFHFALAETIFHFDEYTGGSIGLTVPTFSLGSIEFSPVNLTAYYYLALILVIISLVVTSVVVNSNLGKALIATRDSEVQAANCGINIYRYKLITFSTAAFVTGVVGAFYACYLMAIGPEVFSFTLIVNALGMIVVGGMGTLFGPLIGGFVITFISELFTSWEAYRPIFVGVAILLILIFAPKGIVDQFQKGMNKIGLMGGVS